MPRRQVPLLGFHAELGASIGEFAGWRVPMDYGSTIKEHLSVRTSSGVFDISHMGRLELKGPDAVELLEIVFTRSMSKTREGFISGPALALNEYARVKDDELWYKISDEHWLSVPNAASAESMEAHLKSVARERGLRVEITDLRDKYCLLALQGPQVAGLVEKLASGEVADLKPLEFLQDLDFAGHRAFLVSRSGWTGEDGFEIWASPKEAKGILLSLVKMGVTPAGIASRDTLRIEMGYVLGGNEYGEDPYIYPCAVSLRYGMGAIDWNKTGYIGERALRACRREGSRWVRVGIVMKKKHSRVIPRKGHKLYVEDQEVGWVTSGTFSPVIGRGIAQSYVDSRYALIGETIEVEVRGRRFEAKIQDFPLIPGKR